MESLLDKILELFSGPNDPASGKKKLMRLVVKNLNSNKFNKFYKVKTGTAEAECALFFYSVYKTVSSAQVFMAGAEKSAQLKQCVINAFLDDKLLAIQKGLSPESIEKRAKEMAPKDLGQKLREEVDVIAAAFKGTTITAVDGCYNLILIFARFAGFDFYGLLKKFDASLQERLFSKTPQFLPVKGEQIIKALQEFLELAGNLDPALDWKIAFKALKAYKNMDVVDPAEWNKIILEIREVKRSNVLELMVQHSTGNPMRQPKMALPPNEHIAESYLDDLRGATFSAIEAIINAKRNAKVKELAKAVFGGADVNRLRYYTVQNHNLYIKNNFEGFTQVLGMNMLKAFLTECYQKDIREVCDLLLIRGQWMTNGMSKELSEDFHSMKGIQEQVNAFDDALSEKGANGIRLKAALVRADRDKSQAKYIRIILNSVNEEAENIIKNSFQLLSNIGKHFKNVLEDLQKANHELIMNWRELESASAEPLGSKLTLTTRKTEAFIQILQLLLQSTEEA